MAVTIARDGTVQTTMGKLRVEFFDFTFDSSYPSGGESFAPDDIGGKLFKLIKGVTFCGGNAASAEYMYCWDTANEKIIVSYPTGGTAPAAVGDPTTPALTHDTSNSVTVTASADDQPTHSATALVAGRGEEIAATTDLSTLQVRLMVIGI